MGQRSRTAQPFRCGASSPINQCSDIAPRTPGTLTTLNLAPSSVFSQLLAWRDGYGFTCFVVFKCRIKGGNSANAGDA